MKTLQPGPRPSRAPSGFALIVVITLMVLLTLLSVGLLSLSTVSLRTSSNALARTEAQANAKMALAIALGELQKLMGPDQRISARGDVMGRDPRVSASIGANTAKAWWVGVAHGDPEQTLEGGRPVAWLVSGLNPSSGPGSQIQGSFPNGEPVPMFGENSLDLAKYTGGQPLEAGRVEIRDHERKISGSYAWMIDDEGLKAQLAPTNPLATNQANAGRGMLAGGFDLRALNEMTNLTDQSPESFAKVASLGELQFLGADASIAARKHFDYTTRSYGVLADVRNGGLKRDLTIAFENEQVFNAAFSPTGFPARRGAEDFLVMDAEKLSEATELTRNGYINFRMFKEHYNLKKQIKGSSRQPYLHPTLINKAGFVAPVSLSPFHAGQQGPHDIPSNHTYGDLDVSNYGGVETSYLQAPITPVLAYLQMNGWVENSPSGLETRTQMFTSHYNPYNISIQMRNGNDQKGPRIMNFPEPRFTLTGSFSNFRGMAEKRQVHGLAMTLAPGRSQVYGFYRDIAEGSEVDFAAFGPNIARATNESVIAKPGGTSSGGNSRLIIDFVLDRPALCAGLDQDPGDHEVSQFFFSPFAIDDIGNYPGKRVERSGGIGPNSKLSFAFGLRTTTEGDGTSVRPLIDANIRAIWNNPKWDSPLDLPALAAYSVDNDLVPEGGPGALIPMDSDRAGSFSFWGAGRDNQFGSPRVILFDVPREDLVSIGQLQHANIGRFSYEPTYIVGNSYANPRIPLDDWKGSITDTYSERYGRGRNWAIRGNFNLYDASYLVNEVLFDRYVFTTIPQVADNFTRDDVPANYGAILNGDLLLPNPRFIPYEPVGSEFNASTLQQRGGAGSGSHYHNAGHLLVDGAFNVNSTSVDAWEAFLSGTSELPVQQIDENGMVTGYTTPNDRVRFTRVKTPMGEGTNATEANEDFWIGFRELEQEEVRELATAIVAQIRNRGPSYGLGEFVNRRLANDETGRAGPLQAALDLTVNNDLISDLSLPAENPAFEAGEPQQAAGFPGHLLQGDILQALSPFMTARSDTFTIRAYGESIDPATGNVQARAWCEASVQRYPDPVTEDNGGGDVLSELINPSSEFGREFRVQSFRWLSPDEI